MREENKKKFRSDLILWIVVGSFLALFSAFVIYLIGWGFLNTFKTSRQFSRDPLGLPTTWSFDSYTAVWQKFYVHVTTQAVARKPVGIFVMLFNSLVYALGGAVMMAAATCMMAYITAQYPYKISGVITTGVIVLMALPIIGSEPSQIKTLQSLGLYNTLLGALLQKFNFMGMYFLVFQAFFKSMSKEFYEAATIDGASEASIMFRIILPLSKNMLGTIILLLFVGFWNDYQTPLLYFPAHPTLMYGVHYVSTSGDNALSYIPTKLAVSLIVMIPLLVLFLIFRNKIIGNVTMGGVKE